MKNPGEKRIKEEPYERPVPNHSRETSVREIKKKEKKNKKRTHTPTVVVTSKFKETGSYIYD